MFTLRVDAKTELRLIDMWHVDQYFQLIRDNREHLARHLPWPAAHQTVEDTEDYILSARKALTTRGDVGVVVVHEGAIVGGAGLHIIRGDQGEGEIGYWLAADHTGKGIMTRAVKTLLDYGFDTCHLHRIIIRCSVENTKSCAIPDRLGFSEEGILRNHARLHGQYVDLRLWSMLVDEWHIERPNLHFTHQIAPRLSLRLLNKRDASALYTVIDDQRAYIAQTAPWVADVHDPADLDPIIADAQDKYAQYDGLTCVIWRDSAPLGMIAYRYWNTLNGHTQLDYWLVDTPDRAAILTEAVRVLTDYAFAVVDLNRVQVQCPDDQPCVVPPRLGFQQEGLLREARWHRDHYVDMRLYAMLADEWQNAITVP